MTDLSDSNNTLLTTELHIFSNPQVDGTVEALFQESGERAWTTNCTALGYNCSGTDAGTRGEFSLAESGAILFYGDVNGNILALQLGTLNAPTLPPTDFPTTGVPSTAPSVAPSAITDVPSASPSGAPAAPTEPPVEGGSPTEPPVSAGHHLTISMAVGFVLSLAMLLV